MTSLPPSEAEARPDPGICPRCGCRWWLHDPEDESCPSAELAVNIAILPPQHSSGDARRLLHEQLGVGFQYEPTDATEAIYSAALRAIEIVFSRQDRPEGTREIERQLREVAADANERCDTVAEDVCAKAADYLATLPPQHSSGDAPGSDLQAVDEQLQRLELMDLVSPRCSVETYVKGIKEARRLLSLCRQDRPDVETLALGLLAALEPHEVARGTDTCHIERRTLRRVVTAFLARLAKQDRPAPDAWGRAAALLRQARDDYRQHFPPGHQFSPSDAWAYSLNAVEAALASRPAPDGGVLPAELRELSEKATAGEWAVYPDRRPEFPSICAPYGEAGVIAVAEMKGAGINDLPSNARFITAAVNFVRSLAASPSALSGEGVE